MLIIAARYAFIFWFFIGSGENRLIEIHDKNIFEITACTARCIQAQQEQYAVNQIPSAQNQAILPACLALCNESNKTAVPATAVVPPLKNIQEHFSLNLICRDDRSLTFKITPKGTTAAALAQKWQKTFRKTQTSSPSNTTEPADLIDDGTLIPYADVLFFIRIHASTDTDNYIVYLSDENFFTISELEHRTAHNITVVAVHASNEYSIIAKEQQFSTLARGYTPGNVTDIQIKEFKSDKFDKQLLLAKVLWKPAADRTCNYGIICFTPEDTFINTYEVQNWRQLYTYHLDNLKFSTKYHVGIRAKNTNNFFKESEVVWKRFTTPSCVEWHNYNFNICAPAEPKGLTVERTYLNPLNVFSLTIEWELPEHLPAYYTVRILDWYEPHATEQNNFIQNVSKELNSLFVPKIYLYGPNQDIHVTAYTPGGNATAVTQLRTMAMPKKMWLLETMALILAPILCVVIISLTLFIIYHRRAKLRRYQERCKYFEELEKKAPIDPKATFDLPSKGLQVLTNPEDLKSLQWGLEEKISLNDSMEIDRSDVTLHEVLGEGAFGLVRRGIYNDVQLGAREVAVKMLKDNPTLDDIRAFRREIEVMKSVEKHPNIVGIIGHCTQLYNEIMLLTEYCSFGNLLEFLRNEWKYLHESNVNSNCAIVEGLNVMIAQQQQQPQRQQDKIVALLPSQQAVQEQLNNKSSARRVDATIIEKIKFKYRNRPAPCDTKERQNDCLHKTSHIEVLSTATATATADAAVAVTSATDNQSYGYPELCTNACKCHVNVIIKDIDPLGGQIETEQLEKMLMQKQQHDARTPQKTIEVKNCECKWQQNNRSKSNNEMAGFGPSERAQEWPVGSQAPSRSIENKAYLTDLPDLPEPTTKMQHTARHSPGDDSLGLGPAKRIPLTAADLLDIAKQVAIGMEFLAKNKVVHRDLAARNVLVAPDRTVKIADFGLSRDIYQENIYKKTGNGKLPIKWLALESMTHQVYTTQSDVWSYGILLYEIATLGGTPYPSVPTNRLLHILKAGFRMEKPTNCGQEFYNLMHSCWHVNPGERPNFTEIIKNIDNLLLDEPERQIENLASAAIEPKTQEAVTSAGDTYLKPL